MSGEKSFEKGYCLSSEFFNQESDPDLGFSIKKIVLKDWTPEKIIGNLKLFMDLSEKERKELFENLADKRDETVLSELTYEIALFIKKSLIPLLIESEVVTFEELEKVKKKKEIFDYADFLFEKLVYCVENPPENISQGVHFALLTLCVAMKNVSLFREEYYKNLIIKDADGSSYAAFLYNADIDTDLDGKIVKAGEKSLFKNLFGDLFAESGNLSDLGIDLEADVFRDAVRESKEKSTDEIVVNEVLKVRERIFEMHIKFLDVDRYYEEDLFRISFKDITKIHNLILEFEKIANDNKRMAEKFEKKSKEDPLTGITNRGEFNIELGHEFNRFKRTEEAFSTILIDIDHFKEVNDKYGHLAGDHVLKAIAVLLKNNSRKIDVVARYGGEEFVILLPGTDIVGAYSLAEKIRKNIEESEIILENGREVPVSASFGFAQVTADMEKADNLLNKADGALYKAKEEGRNRVCAGNFEDIIEKLNADRLTSLS